MDAQSDSPDEYFTFDQLHAYELSALIDEHEGIIDRAIVCSTGEAAPVIIDILRRRIPYVITMDTADAGVPVKNLYLSPETLGQDRLAAAVGAAVVLPGRNVLVVDFGTAITFDLVTAGGEYAGGNISPGVDMRFRALNHFTERLPLCSLSGVETLIGNHTEQAIANGVANGVEFEVKGYMDRLKSEYDDLAVIFTGGGAEYFVEKFKNAIFANYDLVSIGLNRILNYNADKK